MNFTILDNLNFQHFKEMRLLEQQFYDDNFIAPAEEAYKWYVKYPYTTIAASNGEKIIGFVNLFPVKKEIFELIKDGKFNDQTLTLDDIDSLNNENLHMFLSCIVVSNEYRKTGITRKLLQKAVSQYDHIKEHCKWIVTDNVTEEGASFSEKYGFTFVCHSNHDSKIYIQSYKSFIDKLF